MSAPAGRTPILRVENLTKHFPVKTAVLGPVKQVRAVDGVTFTVMEGETLGLVGESGCGKTTAGRTILRLYEPTAGSVSYRGQDITGEKSLALRRRMQYIFQDPYASLDPRMTVGDIIAEAIDTHRLAKGREERRERIRSLLSLVGLAPDHENRYAHEFSGGQRQRIGIARALAVKPEFIVCDEPVSALDVSIQAQILNMLDDLQKELGLTYLFIAHDLAVVRHISDRIGVMYLGKLIELCGSNELYAEPLHPYTQALLSAIPVPNPALCRAKKRIVLEGEVPSPIDPPSGCRFRTRCPKAMDICSKVEPPWKEARPGRYCACHLYP